jgi:hypothetical protein
VLYFERRVNPDAATGNPHFGGSPGTGQVLRLRGRY